MRTTREASGESEELETLCPAPKVRVVEEARCTSRKQGGKGYYVEAATAVVVPFRGKL
jgi:hypothetical protein